MGFFQSWVLKIKCYYLDIYVMLKKSFVYPECLFLCVYLIPQSKKVHYWISVLCYSEEIDTSLKYVFEDQVKHKNPNYQCNYFGSECPYKGITFLEKLELKDM